MFNIIYLSTVMHEEAHVEINRFFGMDSTYEVNVGWDGISGLTTQDINDEFYSPEDRRAAYMIHGINEAIGYQLKPLLIGIMAFLLIILMLLTLILFGGINNGKNNNRRETIERKRSHCDGLEQPIP